MALSRRDDQLAVADVGPEFKRKTRIRYVDLEFA